MEELNILAEPGITGAPFAAAMVWLAFLIDLPVSRGAKATKLLMGVFTTALFVTCLLLAAGGFNLRVPAILRGVPELTVLLGLIGGGVIAPVAVMTISLLRGGSLTEAALYTLGSAAIILMFLDHPPVIGIVGAMALLARTHAIASLMLSDAKARGRPPRFGP